MKLAIMQPTFNPWVGYFDLINSVDIFVFLDNVQLEKRSWQVRNKVKSNDDKEIFISIPIKKIEHRDNTLINTAVINGYDWAKKALKTIKHNYSKSKYFKEVYPFIEKLILNKENYILSDYNINIIKSVSDKLAIKTSFIRASSINNLEGAKDKLLLSICKSLNASTYISPKGSSVYLQKNNAGEKYKMNRVGLYYSDYVHPRYSQVGRDFIEYLGIFDLLFNEGFENAKSIISSGHREYIYYKDFANEN
ncbi:WbqC family protein [Francisella salimarina]|uniref:WbqC family protein n=1 Tax=Francisella salimarina TaxID=2599927 RepID=UPI003750E577